MDIQYIIFNSNFDVEKDGVINISSEMTLQELKKYIFLIENYEDEEDKYKMYAKVNKFLDLISKVEKFAAKKIIDYLKILSSTSITIYLYPKTLSDSYIDNFNISQILENEKLNSDEFFTSDQDFEPFEQVPFDFGQTGQTLDFDQNTLTPEELLFVREQFLNSKNQNIELLIDKIEHESFNEQFQNGFSFIHIAIFSNLNLKIFNLLKKAGCNFETKNDFQDTPLLMAVKLKNVNPQTIEALINSGSNVNAVDAAGNTPLHLSIMNRQKEIFDILLDKANLEISNNQGLSPINLAKQIIQEEEYFINKMTKNGRSY